MLSCAELTGFGAEFSLQSWCWLPSHRCAL